MLPQRLRREPDALEQASASDRLIHDAVSLASASDRLIHDAVSSASASDRLIHSPPKLLFVSCTHELPAVLVCELAVVVV